jgi:hypothetical protein
MDPRSTSLYVQTLVYRPLCDRETAVLGDAARSCLTFVSCPLTTAYTRIGPGKKFAQVEFVRLIFTLFANGSRVEVVRNADESEQAAKARVLKMVDEARVEVTLKMNAGDAEKARLRWTKVPVTT